LQAGRLVDAIRVHGFSSAIGEALTAVEKERKAIVAQLSEATRKPSVSLLEASMLKLKQAVLDHQAGEASIPEINSLMRVVFERLMIHHKDNLIELRFADGSRNFIAMANDAAVPLKEFSTMLGNRRKDKVFITSV
jgi:hypothetical protein